MIHSSFEGKTTVEDIISESVKDTKLNIVLNTNNNNIRRSITIIKI